MTFTDSRKFELIRGAISDLVVENGEHDFLREHSDHVAATGVAAGLAMAGMAGAASGALLASSGSADSVERFTAKVAGIRVAGQFSRVGFKNGDELELVVEPMNDGSHAVYAVRRLRDHTIWMYPHCSRGSRAHWGRAIRMIPVAFLAASAFTTIWAGLMEYYSENPDLSGFLNFTLVVTSALSLVAAVYFPIKVAWKWKPFAQLAEQIFVTLGYLEPSSVDLEKDNRAFWKRHPTEPGRIYAPWVFRTLK